ncbi:MAG TPA: IS481 family transposase [Bryobacteraceae bacterium]
MDQRVQLIQEYQAGESIQALAEIYQVSRKTIYKWLERYKAQGVAGLEDHSRAPHRSPRRLGAERIEAIIAARQRWGWGPRKLRWKLEQTQPEIAWPSPSSIAAVLKQAGLSVSRRRRARTPPRTQPFAAIEAPNQTWCADFKGWFRTGDGTRCDPLTLTDAFSRYLLRCHIVPKTDGLHAAAVFDAAFHEYGLPRVIRTDNGSPFASPAPGGLSRLSMRWIKLGIVPERTRPASPQENGRHERMHRTLKAATLAPPARDARAQQRAFDRFRREFNEQRPHEALGQATPASCYQPSLRAMPRRLPELVFAPGMILRRVTEKGDFRLKSERIFISEIFARAKFSRASRWGGAPSTNATGKCFTVPWRWAGWTAIAIAFTAA